MTFPPRVRAAVKGVLRIGASCAGKLTTSTSPPGPRILCYHGVDPSPRDEWSVTPAQLREQMALVATEFVPVSIEQVGAWVLGRVDLPRRAVAVTFDDGYADVHDHAAAILAEFGIPGAAFVSPEFCDRKGPVPGVGYEALRPMMGWREVHALKNAGWTIGSHALTHARLSGLADDDVRTELATSRDRLRQAIGADVDQLAYPYGTPGAATSREHAIAREVGYQAAYMAVTGAPKRGGDPYAIPRAKVLGADSPFVFRAIVAGELDIWRHVESAH